MDNLNVNNDDDLRRLALELMKAQDAEVIEEIPEAKIVPDLTQEPDETTGIFAHEVESVQLWVQWHDGTYHKVNGYHGVNRRPVDGLSSTPEILHIAPDTSSIIGMGEIESIAEQLLDAGYQYHNHGELKNNKWLFIELEHPDLPKMHFNGTSLVPKMFLGSSHDGTLALKSTVKIVDTICYNTFMMNHRSDLLFKAKHTRNATYRIKEYKQGINDASDLLNQYYDQVSKLADTQFGGKQNLEKYFATTIGAKKMERTRKHNGQEYKTEPMFSGKHENQISQLFESYQDGAGQDKRGSTLWSAFSGVTDWCDNHPANEKSVQLGTNLIGNRARQKQTAWDFANSLADVI